MVLLGLKGSCLAAPAVAPAGQLQISPLGGRDVSTRAHQIFADYVGSHPTGGKVDTDRPPKGIDSLGGIIGGHAHGPGQSSIPLRFPPPAEFIQPSLGPERGGNRGRVWSPVPLLLPHKLLAAFRLDQAQASSPFPANGKELARRGAGEYGPSGPRLPHYPGCFSP